MEKELDPFVRRATEEERVEILAGEVLDAIAQGRDIDIKYATILGDLDIGKIENRNDSKFCIKGNVCIVFRKIRGYADLSIATFSRNADFMYATFGGDADFSHATFRGYANANFNGATFSSSPSTFGLYSTFESPSSLGQVSGV